MNAVRLIIANSVLFGLASVFAMSGEGTNARFSPDGRHLLFQAEQEGRIAVGEYEISSGRVRWPDLGAGASAQPTWCGKDRFVCCYMHDTAKTALVAEKSGSQDGFGLRLWEHGAVRDLTRGRWRDYTPSFSTDGKSVYFATTRDQAQRGFLQRGASIWKLAFADGSAECVVQVDAYNAGAIEPAESPDGRFLAWARMNGFRDIWHVVVARKDELGRVFELTPSDTPAHAPTWTPCGRYLAFAACAPNDPGWCVYVVNLAEGTWCNTGLGRNPSFSPDGKTLVCDDGRDWSMRPFPPREAFVPMREEKYAVGEVAFSVGPIPAGATRRPLPRETDFGTGDFWVSLAVACDPAAKGVRLFADGVYRSHKSAFQLHVDNAIRYPGASLALRTAKGEWFGTGPAPISGNGRHVVTGVKREGWIALYVDGRECVRRPVMEGICALSGPVAVSFKAENGTIHGFACGRGWPAALARPTRAELFGKEVTP